MAKQAASKNSIRLLIPADEQRNIAQSYWVVWEDILRNTHSMKTNTGQCERNRPNNTSLTHLNGLPELANCFLLCSMLTSLVGWPQVAMFGTCHEYSGLSALCALCFSSNVLVWPDDAQFSGTPTFSEHDSRKLNATEKTKARIGAGASRKKEISKSMEKQINWVQGQDMVGRFVREIIVLKPFCYVTARRLHFHSIYNERSE
jgi:hypothetical protein